MRRIIAGTCVLAAVTIGTASASSLGLSDTTVFAADTVLIAECTVENATIGVVPPVTAPTEPLPVGQYELTGVVGCDDGVVDLVLYGVTGLIEVIEDAGEATNGVHEITTTLDVPALEAVTAFDLIIRDASS